MYSSDEEDDLEFGNTWVLDHIKDRNPGAYSSLGLEKCKGQCIGSGLHAFTYNWGSKQVLKLTRSRQHARVAAKLLSIGSKIKHLVRVFKVVRIKHTEFTCIIEERLYPLSADEWYIVCDNTPDLPPIADYSGKTALKKYKTRVILNQLDSMVVAADSIGLQRITQDCFYVHNIMKDSRKNLTLFDFGFTSLKNSKDLVVASI